MGRYPPLGQLGPRAISEWGLRTQAADVVLEGRANVPRSGPVLLIARHYHHLLDGAVLVTRLPRPLHIVVALDWAATAGQRRWMEMACRAADYPVVLRPPTVEQTGAFRREEIVRYTRAALRDASRLLRAGRVVLVFPEGYPNIDPAGSRKPGDDAWLPFAGGFTRIAELAECDRTTRVEIVPVGFSYTRTAAGRWSVHGRIGTPLDAAHRSVACAEAAVRELSMPRSSVAERTGSEIKEGPPPERRALH